MWDTKVKEPEKREYKKGRWDKEEIKTLLKMWEGHTIDEISLAINRTPTGIANLSHLLRKKFGVPLSPKGLLVRTKMVDLVRETLDELNINYKRDV